MLSNNCSVFSAFQTVLALQAWPGLANGKSLLRTSKAMDQGKGARRYRSSQASLAADTSKQALVFTNVARELFGAAGTGLGLGASQTT
jgi:hypothetical protein